MNHVICKGALNLTVICLLLTSVACRTPKSPDGFIYLGESRGHKFVSSDDAKVWIRKFEVEKDGDLEFWKEVLHKEFVETRGYKLVDESALGKKAHEMTYSRLSAGRETIYYLRISLEKGLTGASVETAEFMAEKESFEKHKAAVLKALNADS